MGSIVQSEVKGVTCVGQWDRWLERTKGLQLDLSHACLLPDTDCFSNIQYQRLAIEIFVNIKTGTFSLSIRGHVQVQEVIDLIQYC